MKGNNFGGRNSGGPYGGEFYHTDSLHMHKRHIRISPEEFLTRIAVIDLLLQVVMALVAAAEVATAHGDINYFMFW